MHELSIANNIITVIEEQLKNENFSNVLSINIEIGKFSCVSVSSLEFCFEVVSKDTILMDSKLKIKEIEPEILCNSCNKKSNVDIDKPLFICPLCSSSDVILQKGEELQIKSVEVE